jgi:NADH-quinone oxidoreductase subunit F
MMEVPKEQQTLFSYRHETGSHTLKVALEHEAYEGLKIALTLKPFSVTETVKDSGLRGRGGAGFPAGTKWGFMPKDPAPGRPHILLVNADESEPGTFKDHEIMRKVPHKLIEGAVITCWAVKAHICYIYLRGEYVDAYRILSGALKEAEEAGFAGKNILGSGFDCDITICRGAGAYICGEETALLDSLEGKRGYPRIRPPYAVTVGAFGLPTVINNVETIASVPWIVHHGADAYRRWGTEKSPGTKIFSVSGHVNNPGNYECSLGITLRDLLETAGGMLNGAEFKACLPGGTSVPFLNKSHLDVPMDYQSLAAAGSMLGSGGAIVMDQSTDLVKIVHRCSRFYEKESCGKCTPCHQGTWWMTRIFERILRGDGTPDDIVTLRDVASNIKEKSFCLLGDASAESVISLIDDFPSEFDRYITARSVATVGAQ